MSHRSASFKNLKAGALACFLTTILSLNAFASDPTTGSLTPTSNQVTWVGTGLAGVNPAPQLGEESHDALCAAESVNCDSYILKVSGTNGDWTGKVIQVRLAWQLATTDYDMYVHRGSATGPVIARSATGPNNYESDTIDPTLYLDPDPVTGITEFHVHVIYFNGGAADQYNGAAIVINADNSLRPAPIDTGVAPRYQNYTPTQEQIAAGMTRNASDEPSIGVNWKTNTVMFQALLQTLRLKFNEGLCKQSPSCTWENKSPLTASGTTFDPILFTDPETGRTQSGQLLFNPMASATSYTDDDGETWIPSQGSGVGSGVDHQTIGGGPLHAPLFTGTGYKNGVYYCSQDIALANCALSLDGGLTYGPAVPIYNLNQCEGLHGHLKVGPDGTAYIPNATCVGVQNAREQALIVSENNGISWEVRPVRGSIEGNGSDPSLSIDRTGRIYFGYVSGDKHAAVAISEDRGHTWRDLYDVGTMAGVKTAAFPAATAGDDGRAAIAFYGTRDEDTNATPASFAFNGTWDLYVAHTYDAGKSWITVNATPNDPLQRGGIHLGGGGEIHRNLLDFFDATVDNRGNVIVGYADGCLGSCVQAPVGSRGNSYVAFGTVARQTGGRRLQAQYDSTSPTAPGAPRVTVTRNGTKANITWSLSENGGAAVTGFEVRRSSAGASEEVIATLGGTANQFTDSAAIPNKTYTYRVVAINSLGQSCGENAVTAAPTGSSCARPGIRVVTDKDGDQAGGPANQDMDIQSISIAEPYFEDGSQKLEITMKVASLATLVPNRMWRMTWKYPDGPGGNVNGFVGRYYVGMNTDDAGAVSFEYGIQESLSAVLADASPAQRLGSADAESTYLPDGTIRIVISNSKVGNPKVGDLVGGLIGRAYPVRQNETLRSDTAADSVTFADAYMLVGNASCKTPATITTCFENNNKAVSYIAGWHQVNSASASGGTFHYRTGNAATAASFTFNVASGATGSLVYHYATSTKGGTADVYIDGAFKTTINFNGTAGDHKSPVFGSSMTFGALSPGDHTFELRNTKGAIFVDRFCLQSAYYTSTSQSGPGSTNSSVSTLAPLEELVQTVVASTGTKTVTAVAEGATNSSFKLVLVSPAGSVLNTAQSSNGVATLEVPVSATGAYVVKAINTGLSATEVWMLTTPWGAN